MNLTFEKQGNKYVAEFEATSDFNLHIEKGNGTLSVLQSSVAGGKYDGVPSLRMMEVDAVLDTDVIGVIYPKQIRIVSEVLPTLAVVTFNA